MIVYRICDCRYINDLSGRGAALYGGRWNSKDIYMLYTAQSRALALLEAVVHIGKMPGMGYCLATIEIPENSTEVLPLSKLPGSWQNNPAPDYLKLIGDRFIRSGRHLVLSVPSVLMMEEHNLLLNPLHPAFRQVRVVEQRALNMDDRLFPQ